MIRIDFIESADPLFRLLRSRPEEVFGRPYAGYIIFLFGIADEFVANWMRTQLISLDSLTGPDIAGVVFAKRVGVKALITMGSPPPPWATNIRNDGTVELSDISFTPLPMVRNGAVDWEDSLKEIQATTYATDEIARAFGLIADLPCLVIADAVPTPQLEVFRLTETVLPDVIPLLRTTIGDFLQTARIGGYLAHLKALQHLSEARQKLASQINSTELLWNKKIDRVDVGAPERLRRALLAGNEKEFEQQLHSMSDIPADALGKAADLSRQHAKYVNTLNSLSWHLDRENWPPVLQAKQRVDLICDKYLSQLLPHYPVGFRINAPEDWEAIKEQLKLKQKELAATIWDNLPTLEALQQRKQAEIDAIKLGAETALVPLREEISILEEQIRREVSAVLTDAPSIQRSFRNALRGQKVQGVKHALTRGALDFLAAFLKPDTRQIVARDIFVNQITGNVDKIGTFAKVDGDVTF